MNRNKSTGNNIPKTLFQKIVFGVIMSYIMTYGMEFYNVSIKMGFNLSAGGFSNIKNIVFLETLKEVWFMGIIVFIVSGSFGNRMGILIAEKHINNSIDNRYICQIVRQACTIGVMCPAMSLIASVIFSIIFDKKPVLELPAIWAGTVMKNFPMAFFLNMYIAAPLTRKIYGLIFKDK
jgi:hypothetical protein